MGVAMKNSNVQLEIISVMSEQGVMINPDVYVKPFTPVVVVENSEE